MTFFFRFLFSLKTSSFSQSTRDEKTMSRLLEFDDVRPLGFSSFPCLIPTSLCFLLQELDEIFGTNIAAKKPEEKTPQQPQQAKAPASTASVFDLDDDDIFGTPVGSPLLHI